MKLLNVQEFLETRTFGDLINEHGVYASFSKSGHKFSLNYDQIEAKESDPLAQECRGLVLSFEDGVPRRYTSVVNGKPTYNDLCPGKTVILAYPMKRFFNYCQGCAANIDWSAKDLSILEKLDGCFTYNTLLTCWDGSVIKIGEIVKKKLKLTLIGRDENGTLIPCEILDWFDNGTKDNWLEIETNTLFRGKKRKFLVTSNHALLINNEFIPAFTAKIGDNLTSYEEYISDDVIHLIESSLLGDATLTKNGKNFKYEEGHKQEHEEFIYQIRNWLGECFSNFSNHVSGFGTPMIRVSSKPNIIITKLRKKWYKNGIKKIPNSLDWMTDFSVAKWFMDDGSLCHNDNQKDRAHFATNGFSKNEVIRLGKRLHEMYSVDCSFYYSKGWNLRINAGKNGEINKFWQSIAPYIVPCMRYKLPIEFRNVQFINSISGKMYKTSSHVKITKIKKIEISKLNNKKIFPNGRKGYDIKTSTANYMANGVIVHNSLCIVYYDLFTNKWCVATRSVPEADLTMDNGLFTFRTLFEKALKETNGLSFEEFTDQLNARITYCFELTTPYNRIVVNYPDCRVTLLAARPMYGDMKEFDFSNLDGPGWVDYKDLTNEIKEHLTSLGHDANDTPAAFVHKPYELCGVPTVQSYTFTSIENTLEWVASLDPMKHEGIVAKQGENRVKVKNPSYVAYNRVRDTLGASERNCVEIILQEKDDDVIPFLPEEIVKNLQKIKTGLQIAIRRYDEDYQAAKSQADAEKPGDKKTFAIIVTKNKDLWNAPFFQMFDGKASNMKEFIAKNRKNGSWGDSFLDKMLELAKQY